MTRKNNTKTAATNVKSQKSISESILEGSTVRQGVSTKRILSVRTGTTPARQRRLSMHVAILTAAALIAASVQLTPMTAFADTWIGDQTDVVIRGGGDTSKEITIEGNVQNQNTCYAIDMRDSSTEKLNANLTVNGDVTAINHPLEAPSAVFIWSASKAGEATVHVTGDVLIDTSAGDGGDGEYGVFISNAKSEVTIDQNVKVTADINTANGIIIGAQEKPVEISVGKSIEAFSAQHRAIGMGVSVGSASIEVGEDINVSAGNNNNASGIAIGQLGTDYVDKDIDIRVKGNIEAKQLTEFIVTHNRTTDGIVIQNDRNLNLIVDGDVTGTTHGVNVWENYGKAEIVVGGTISNLSERSAAINVEKQETNQNAPNITVWKIESGSDKLVSSREWNYSSYSYVEDPDYADTVQRNINYIIKGNVTENGEDTSNGKIVLKGTSNVTIGTGDKARTYETAHQDEEITINVETVSGYKYSLSDTQGLLTRNSDGSYTLKVPAGGGVELLAVLERIAEDNKNSGRALSTRNSSYSHIVGGDAGKAVSNTAANALIETPGTWALDALGNWIFAGDGFNYTDTWIVSGGRWYFLDGNGNPLIGWQTIGTAQYFLSPDNIATHPFGSLYINETTPDGIFVNASGARNS